MNILEEYEKDATSYLAEARAKAQLSFDTKVKPVFVQELTTMLEVLELDSIKFCYTNGVSSVIIKSAFLGGVIVSLNLGCNRKNFITNQDFEITPKQSVYIKWSGRYATDYHYDINMSDTTRKILSFVGKSDSLATMDGFTITKESVGGELE